MTKSKSLFLFVGVFLPCVFISVASAYAAPFAYITNLGGNTVSVIDTSTNTVAGVFLLRRKRDGIE